MRENKPFSLNQCPRSLPWINQALGGAILPRMKVEEIAEAIAKLPPDQLARFRRWFAAFEAGRSDHAKELDSTATKLGRLALGGTEKAREGTVSSERSPDRGL